MIAAEKLAQAFHDAYEELAPSFGYETREDSRKPWSEVPEANRALMVAVAHHILDCHLRDLAALYGFELGEATRDGVCGHVLKGAANVDVSQWLGACVLRPQHRGMHEDADCTRWQTQDDGSVVVDGSATRRTVIGGIA